MEGYLYETHSHTSEASACGKVSGSDYTEFMKKRGFQGMIITDHFLNGNTAIDKRLPWKEQVAGYVSGYKKALEAAKGKDFDVLFGVEFNFQGDEYLIYGIDEQWLLENEQIMFMSRKEVYEHIHATADVVLVQAHPYRERGYLKDIKLMPEICDGIEVYNAANPDYQNALGYQYAKKLDLPMTAGSDIHFYNDDAMGGMLLPKRIHDTSEYVQIVRAREGIPVSITLEGHMTPVTEMEALTVPTREPDLEVHYVS